MKLMKLKMSDVSEYRDVYINMDEISEIKYINENVCVYMKNGNGYTCDNKATIYIIDNYIKDYCNVYNEDEI